MRVLNKIDRYHLVIDMVKSLNLGFKGEEVIKEMQDNLNKHHEYIREYGVDMPEISEWTW